MSSSKWFATDRDCRKKKKKGVLYFKGHLVYKTDPYIGSGSSSKDHRSIRIDCGDPAFQLQQQQ